MQVQLSSVFYILRQLSFSSPDWLKIVGSTPVKACWSSTFILSIQIRNNPMYIQLPSLFSSITVITLCLGIFLFYCDTLFWTYTFWQIYNRLLTQYVVTMLPSRSHGLSRLQPKYPCNALFKIKRLEGRQKGREDDKGFVPSSIDVSCGTHW